MRISGRLTFIIGCALLASCGGDDSSPPPISGGGTPSPSPTPTPTPTPTPVSYTRFADLTGDRSFDTACGGVNLSTLQPILASDFGEGLDEGKSLELSFTAGTSTWNIAGPAFTDNFGPANLSASPPPDTVLYQKPSALVPGISQIFAIAARPMGTQAPEYVRGLRLFYTVEAGRQLDFYCVFGVPTLLSDSRPTSTISYTSFAVGGTMRTTSPGGGLPLSFDLRDSTVTLTANPTNGEVTTALTLVGRQLQAGGALSDTVTQFGTFNGTGTTNGTAATYLGTLSSPGRVVPASQFGGWFFGPQGLEAGYAFNVMVELSDGSRQVGAGAVTARR